MRHEKINPPIITTEKDDLYICDAEGVCLTRTERVGSKYNMIVIYEPGDEIYEHLDAIVYWQKRERR